MRLTHEARKIQSMPDMPNSKEYPVRRALLSGQDAAGYAVTFPGLPGCMSEKETTEEARATGRGACNAWMRASIEDNRAMPVPWSGAILREAHRGRAQNVCT